MARPAAPRPARQERLARRRPASGRGRPAAPRRPSPGRCGLPAQPRPVQPPDGVSPGRHRCALRAAGLKVQAPRLWQEAATTPRAGRRCQSGHRAERHFRASMPRPKIPPCRAPSGDALARRRFVTCRTETDTDRREGMAVLNLDRCKTGTGVTSSSPGPQAAARGASAIPQARVLARHRRCRWLHRGPVADNEPPFGFGSMLPAGRRGPHSSRRPAHPSRSRVKRLMQRRRGGWAPDFSRAGGRA